MIHFAYNADAAQFNDSTGSIWMSLRGSLPVEYAWEKADWNLMTQILADGFTFSSPHDDHIKINVVKERCWPNAGKIKSVGVQQLIMYGNAVVVIANGYTTAGKLFRNCDYFTIKDGKISAYECFFGPSINYPNNSAK